MACPEGLPAQQQQQREEISAADSLRAEQWLHSSNASHKWMNETYFTHCDTSIQFTIYCTFFKKYV